MSQLDKCCICGWIHTIGGGFMVVGESQQFDEHSRDLLEFSYWWACVPRYIRRQAIREEPRLANTDCDICWPLVCRQVLNGKWIVWRNTPIDWFWVLWEWNLPAPSGFGWRSDLSNWWYRAKRDFRTWWDSL